MSLLRRAPVEGSAAAARVAELLARPGRAGGWVPPPVFEDEAAAGLPAAGVTASTDPPAPPPGAQLVGGGHVARHAAEDTALPEGDHPEDPSPQVAGPVGSALAGVPPVGPERSWAARRLPSPLAGGRLDPGRAGAAALLVVALLAAVVAGAVVLRGRPVPVEVPQVVASGVPLPGASPAADPSGEVVVSVAGTVVRPGLVRLPAGSRVDDALRAAGGLAPGGEVGLLNLARRVVDGEQVLVGVAAPPGAPAGPTVASGGRLDLNTATVADLDALPGIGPVLAQRIVDWRTEHGRFSSVDELREVTGIGPSKFDDLEDAVVV